GGSCAASWLAPAAWTCCCSTNSATSSSTPRGAELLFQIITEREERASIGIATNLPFSKAHMFAATCASRPPKYHGFGGCWERPAGRGRRSGGGPDDRRPGTSRRRTSTALRRAGIPEKTGVSATVPTSPA